MVPEETHTLDSILTIGNDIIIGVDGNEMTMTTDPQDPLALVIKDEAEKTLDLVPTDVSPIYTFTDEDLIFVLSNLHNQNQEITSLSSVWIIKNKTGYSG